MCGGGGGGETKLTFSSEGDACGDDSMSFQGSPHSPQSISTLSCPPGKLLGGMGVQGERFAISIKVGKCLLYSVSLGSHRRGRTQPWVS